MTAEILIMNKTAIALAADSAATISFTENGQTKYKIYNASNKLFMLSKYYPVGIMIYSNSEILGYPWELVIKQYRKKLKNKHFKKVEEYANDFICYLETYFPIDIQLNYFGKYLTAFYHEKIIAKINKTVKDETKIRKVSRKRIKDITKQIINESFVEFLAITDTNQIAHEKLEKIKKDNIEFFRLIVTQSFHNLPISMKDKKLLIKMAEFIFSKQIFLRHMSGIVIAGFGEDESFPSAISIDIDGVFFNCLLYEIIHTSSISENMEAVIIPFAQKEMVATFMSGVDPEYKNLLFVYLQKLFTEYPKVLINELLGSENNNQDILNVLNQRSNDLLQNFKRKLEKFQQETNIDKIIHAVRYMPIDELSSMAESLVNLTSIKRRVTFDYETVGGPIDVAVISKGDGFVWIKRKHYFDEKLNHHFFNNYYKDCNERN